LLRKNALVRTSEFPSVK